MQRGSQNMQGKCKRKEDVPGQGHTSTSSWRLVHLTKHQSNLGLAIELNDTSFLHFVVEIVALTGALADSGEDGVTAVCLGDVVLEGSASTLSGEWSRLTMSSWMNTVFPTPAPPKSPIFPPRAYGAMRSTTLMPVIKTSAEVDCSTNAGGSAWMGSFFSCLMGPRSSMGSPVTFMMRPRVPTPTGTMMGLPVSVAFAPRTRPSVPSMAMHRTVCSPRCCCVRQRSCSARRPRHTHGHFQHQLVATIVGHNRIENRRNLIRREFDWPS